MGSLKKLEVEAMRSIISLKVKKVKVANEDLWDTIKRCKSTSTEEDFSAAMKDVGEEHKEITFVIYPDVPDNPPQFH